MRVMHYIPIQEKGFSMIEVLVSLIILCIGILGMAALQTKSIKLTQESIQRSNAIMLADDILETIRSNNKTALENSIESQDYNLFINDSSKNNYYKEPGKDFSQVNLASGETCADLKRDSGGQIIAGKDISCWLSQVKVMLPVTNELIKSKYAICPSSKPAGKSSAPYEACDKTSTSSTIMILVAWLDNSDTCPEEDGEHICYYSLRTEL